MEKRSMEERYKNKLACQIPKSVLGKLIYDCIQVMKYNEEAGILEADIESIPEEHMKYLREHNLEKARIPGTPVQWKIENEKLLIGFIGDFF